MAYPFASNSTSSLTSSQQLGLCGEQLALTFLKERGYTILDTNWRHSRYAEIDIIAYCPNPANVSFIEVKTRRQNQDSAVEALNKSKRLKMLEAAQVYMQGLDDPALVHCPMDFQLLSIILDKASQTLIFRLYPQLFS